MEDIAPINRSEVLQRRSTMSNRLPLVPLAILCAAAATLALTACGGSATKSTAGQESDQQLVKFAKCMREHGLNVSTPTGSSGAIRIGGSGKAGNIHQLEAAQQACKRYQPIGAKQNLSPQEKVERQEQVLKFAKCMREHGIDLHASTTDGGAGIKIQSHSGTGGQRGPNPDSPAFQAAQKACQGLLPAPPGGGKAGGPGGGPSTSRSSAGAGPSLSMQTGG
jgi:hypothetical protein